MELVIAVTIVGILAAIAFPSYSNYLIKSNRSAAQSFMLEVANRQKQYLLDARSYAPDLTTLKVTAPTEVSRLYNVTVSADNNATPPTFLVTAAPLSGKSQASDGNLTLDQVGTKTPANKW